MRGGLRMYFRRRSSPRALPRSRAPNRQVYSLRRLCDPEELRRIRFLNARATRRVPDSRVLARDPDASQAATSAGRRNFLVLAAIRARSLQRVLASPNVRVA